MKDVINPRGGTESDCLIDATDTGEELHTDKEPQKLNDAELIGVDHPDMQELLTRPAVFMTGDLYSQNDRRNTRDGDWKRVEMPLIDWINGGEDGGGWGLSRHPVSKSKEGPSIVLAESLDGARKDAAIKTMYAVGIDIDSGASLDDVVTKLEDLGLFAIVYTSHSHGKDKLVLKHDDIMRKLKLDDSPNRTQIQMYLRSHHKDRFDDDFIDTIEIEEIRKQTPDGLRTILKTRPLDKFRVVLPLWEPVELAQLGATVNQWKDKWADAVCGVAVNTLGVNFDSTSCDVNRLFYTPRHPEGAEWYSCIVQGRPLRFEEIEPYDKDAYVRNREVSSDPFLAGTGAENEREDYYGPGGISLNRWHNKYKERFLIADVLESYCADKLRPAPGEKPGTCHIECPFEHEHSTEGGTATLAMNPDANEAGYWTVFCKHDSCQGRDKLEFVQQMLEDEWFDVSVLTDSEWCVPLPDEEDEEPETGQVAKTPLELAKAFTKESTDNQIKAFLNKLLRKEIDQNARNGVTAELASRTNLSKPDIKKMWKELEAEKKRSQNENLYDDGLDTGLGFNPLVKKTLKKLNKANEETPFLFAYLDKPVLMRADMYGRPKLKTLEYDGLAEAISQKVSFVRTTGDGATSVSVSPPMEVVKNVYHKELYGWTLPLSCIASTPFYDRSGSLVVEEGYHDGSHTYLMTPEGFTVGRVSATPTGDDLARAKGLLIDAFGEFPFDGMTPEMIADGQSASYANTIGLALLPFMREMIPGATPGHLINKPSPGTGAGLLLDVLELVWSGASATTMTLPKRKEEIGKTVIAKLRSGASTLIFDNIPDNLDSDDIAMAITQGRIDARILGKNAANSVEPVEVRATWLFTGNNVTMSEELQRRMTLISLDAHMAEPAKRQGWKHPNLKKWVGENRARLVWACLTLIQNWIAKGKPAYAGDEVKGSFEEWLACVGGVLEAAGIQNFHANSAELRETVADGETDGLAQLADQFADYNPGTKFTAKKVMDLLNKGVDDEAILIPGWGYEDGLYSNARRVGRNFEVFAKKPQLGRRQVQDGFITVEIGFEKEYDAHRKVNQYRLKLRKPGQADWIEAPTTELSDLLA